MQRPPPLNSCLSYPVTTGIGLSAVLVTMWWWNGADINRLMIDYHAFRTEPWRLLTSTLPHANLFHLLFNLYWLWAFGTQIERIFGSAWAFAIMAFLAVGSGTAEYALMSGSVGLSGVGFGLVGLLWVLSRWDPRFSGSVDSQLVSLFIGWFFLCILLTATNTMPIANVAHGAGAVLGVLLGWTIAAKSRKRKIGYGMLISIVFVAIMAAGTAGRRYVNFTDSAAREDSYRAQLFAYYGYQAIINNDYKCAADFYRQALSIDKKQADWWFNLGIIYRRLNMDKESMESYRRAYELAPDNEDFKKAFEESQ